MGNDVKNLINKAKKFYEKLFKAKDKNKAFIKDDLNLLTIKSIISGT